MKKSIIISEADNIAALTENDRVVEFFVNRGELLLGDIYVAIVENILPGIDAAFVNLGKDKMGFLHANDIPGEGALRDRLVPKQKLLVQITKEPTGHKGPRVSTAISLPGRFLVLVPEERGISISRRISESKERSRLKAVVTLMKPPGVGVIIRTEAKGQNEASLFEDFEQLWDRWQSIVSEGEASIGPKLVYRDQDLLYRVIRDAYSTDVTEIIVDTADGQKRAADFMTGWAGRTTKVMCHQGDDSLLISKGIDKDIELVLSDRAELPSGGHLNIQPTEALTVIDVNSGRFTSSRTQAETVRKTNLEAAQEIPRQLRLRNIGGMVIVDFIDMESRRDQQQVLEMFNRSLEDDRAKPQVGQLSDLGLVELTRRRQGQSLRELFAEVCTHCSGTGAVPTLTLGTGEFKRVITLPNREEELAKKAAAKRGGMPLRGGSQLRAVSANSGRIQPTVNEHVAEEENHEITEEIDVPVEILEQMPEELLAGFTGEEEGFGSRSKKFQPAEQEDDEDDEDDDDDEDGDEHQGRSSSSARTVQHQEPAYKGSSYGSKEPYLTKYERERLQQQQQQQNETPQHQHNDESDDEAILAIPEELNNDDDLSVISTVAAVVELEHEPAHQHNNNDDHHHQAEDVEADDDNEPEVVVQATPLPEAESDFDTEVDPVTGIYRLKPKDKNENEGHSAAEALSEDEAHSRENYTHDSHEGNHDTHHESHHEHSHHEHGHDHANETTQLELPLGEIAHSDQAQDSSESNSENNQEDERNEPVEVHQGTIWGSQE